MRKSRGNRHKRRENAGRREPTVPAWRPTPTLTTDPYKRTQRVVYGTLDLERCRFTSTAESRGVEHQNRPMPPRTACQLQSHGAETPREAGIAVAPDRRDRPPSNAVGRLRTPLAPPRLSRRLRPKGSSRPTNAPATRRCRSVVEDPGPHRADPSLRAAYPPGSQGDQKLPCGLCQRQTKHRLSATVSHLPVSAMNMISSPVAPSATTITLSRTATQAAPSPKPGLMADRHLALPK